MVLQTHVSYSQRISAKIRLSRRVESKPGGLGLRRGVRPINARATATLRGYDGYKYASGQSALISAFRHSRQ
jgi:hypothetical protein